MSRSIAYIVILVIFASTMGFFIRSTADKAMRENAGIFDMQARQTLDPEEGEGPKVNSIDSSIAAATPHITIGDATVWVQIADDALERSRGLSGQAALQPNTGMLFLFEDAFIPSFWMKDMNFALDFLWIRDGIVVDITQNVPAPSGNDLPTYSPDQPVDTVLEINAGWVAQRGGEDALIGKRVVLKR